MVRTANDNFDCSFFGEDEQQVAASKAALALAAATSSVVATSTTVESTAAVMAGREEEKDKKGNVKKSHFSKQEGVALERENKFFLGRKEGKLNFLGEEVRRLFFGGTIL